LELRDGSASGDWLNTMSVDTEDAFQKELVELFVQEAQEWLQQIHVALDELQQAPPPDRYRSLAQTIKVGITNLGGSAATINLSDVERASFSTLPFVEAVQEPGARVSAGDFLALCKQLGHIHGALTRATGITFEPEPDQSSVESVPTVIGTKELLVRLHALHEQNAAPGTFSRNLVQTMIVQAEGLMNRGMEQCNLASIQEFFDRLAEEERGFLDLVRRDVPQLFTVFQALRNGGAASSYLRNAMERVSQLWAAAQQVNASHAVTFFMGLHSFLTIVMEQRVMVGANRYAAVHSRLVQAVSSLEEWAQGGHAERAAIQRALRG
jgi:chemotaxis protein histidine kinase CheA